jgi:hypothetical protein
LKEQKYYYLPFYSTYGGYGTGAIKATARLTVRLTIIYYAFMVGLLVVFLLVVLWFPSSSGVQWGSFVNFVKYSLKMFQAKIKFHQV